MLFLLSVNGATILTSYSREGYVLLAIINATTTEEMFMLEETIILRDIYFALEVSVPVFAERIGVGRRMLDRYLNKNCDKVPLKVINSAKWVHYKALGREYVRRPPLKPK